jgi:hypothetical protein
MNFRQNQRCYSEERCSLIKHQTSRNSRAWSWRCSQRVNFQTIKFRGATSANHCRTCSLLGQENSWPSGWIQAAWKSLPGQTGTLSRIKSRLSSPTIEWETFAFPDGAIMQNHFDWPASALGPRWAPRGKAIDYVLTRNGVSNIRQQNLAGGAPKQITNFESGQIFDFCWSRDSRQLAFTPGTESSDVVLISNFR